MKRNIVAMLLVGVMAVLGISTLTTNLNTYAEENSENDNAEAKTGLTLKPLNKTFQISSNSSYDGEISVTNDGSEATKIKVYASPYSFVYSEDEDTYKLGFNNETNFTQISRWITIEDKNGNYTAEPTFDVAAGETLEIKYRISTPNSIPAGGQYAVIFAQTVGSNTNASGIQTEVSAGMVIYGHSTEGETIISATISDSEIGQGFEEQTDNHNFYGSAKIKNDGNVDFFAKGKLKVEPIIGFSSYETPDSESSLSVIPESERVLADEWTETPSFGIYKVTWTVSAGNESNVVERVFFLIPPAAIIITIIVLTIMVILIIIGVRKRKERRSRLAV